MSQCGHRELFRARNRRGNSVDFKLNQNRWAEGGGDNELDRADMEPSLGAPETAIGALSPEDTEGNGGICSVVGVSGQGSWAAGGTRDLESATGRDDDEGPWQGFGEPL